MSPSDNEEDQLSLAICRPLYRTLPSITAILVERKSELCDQHVKQMRSLIPSVAPLSDQAVLDDLGTVIDRIAHAFGSTTGLKLLQTMGPAHAAARDGQRFSVAQILNEYAVFRKNLLVCITTNLSRDLTNDERETLDSALDVVTSATVSSFLNQRESRIQLESEALSDFLSSVAHNVGNEIAGATISLRALSSNLSRILTPGNKSDCDTTSLLKDIEFSETAIESSLKAMKLILEAERLKHTIKPVFRNVDVKLLMKGVVSSVERSDRGSADNSNPDSFSRVIVHCPDNLYILSDPDLLSAVLCNLVQNSIKHTTGNIAFRATRRSERCCIAVEDYGEGIPSDRIERLFDKFERTGSDRSGFGLGLYIAQRAARVIGAKITVQSEAGKGSVFTLELHS